jgi:uncharacterized protein (TIGR02996 family)
MPQNTGAALEAAVFANRDDVAAHRFYADWLQQHGDPRGELIMVQAERLERPDDEALKAAEAAAGAREFDEAHRAHDVAHGLHRRQQLGRRLRVPHEQAGAEKNGHLFSFEGTELPW